MLGSSVLCSTGLDQSQVHGHIPYWSTLVYYNLNKRTQKNTKPVLFSIAFGYVSSYSIKLHCSSQITLRKLTRSDIHWVQKETHIMFRRRLWRHLSEKIKKVRSQLLIHSILYRDQEKYFKNIVVSSNYSLSKTSTANPKVTEFNIFCGYHEQESRPGNCCALVQ